MVTISILIVSGLTYNYIPHLSVVKLMGLALDHFSIHPVDRPENQA
jgi:hypothetical protein